MGSLVPGGKATPTPTSLSWFLEVKKPSVGSKICREIFVPRGQNCPGGSYVPGVKLTRSEDLIQWHLLGINQYNWDMMHLAQIQNLAPGWSSIPIHSQTHLRLPHQHSVQRSSTKTYLQDVKNKLQYMLFCCCFHFFFFFFREA